MSGKPLFTCCDIAYADGFVDGLQTGLVAGYRQGYRNGYTRGYVDGKTGRPPLKLAEQDVKVLELLERTPLLLRCGCLATCSCELIQEVRQNSGFA